MAILKGREEAVAPPAASLTLGSSQSLAPKAGPHDGSWGWVASQEPRLFFSDLSQRSLKISGEFFWKK